MKLKFSQKELLIRSIDLLRSCLNYNDSLEQEEIFILNNLSEAIKSDKLQLHFSRKITKD
jgi:hypothetical protein